MLLGACVILARHLIFLLAVVGHWSGLPRLRGAIRLLLLLVIASALADQAWVIRTNVQQPREWDFPHFWLFGQATAHGANPYEHGTLQELAAPLKPSETLSAQLHCWYPPQSQLLFAPLGHFSLRPAMQGWYVFLELILVCDIWLMWRLFARAHGLDGLLMTAAAVLSLTATTETLFYAQTNFLVLLAVLLYWRDRDHWRAGVWIALGMFVKPLVALIALDLFVRGRLRAVLSGALVTLAATGLTTALFGPELFRDYITRNPVANDYPAEIAAEWVNQSLLATILRIQGVVPSGHGSPILMPLHLTLVALLMGLTAWWLYRCQSADRSWALAMTLPMAFMAYPATMAHYSVLLLIPVMLLLFEPTPRLQRRLVSGVLIAAIYGLVAAEQAFLASLLTWAACLVRASTGAAVEPAHVSEVSA